MADNLARNFAGHARRTSGMVATIERADRKLPSGIVGTQRNPMPDGLPDPRTATSKFRSPYSGFLVEVARPIHFPQGKCGTRALRTALRNFEVRIPGVSWN